MKLTPEEKQRLTKLHDHNNVDFPKVPVNDLVKENYKSAIKKFVGDLKNMISAFGKLKLIESLEYKIK